MPQQLLESIEVLRAELDKPNQLSEADREQLLSVLYGMENTLGEDGKYVVDQHQPLIQQLKDSLWALEKSHPTLTLIVGRVLDNLSRMGV